MQTNKMTEERLNELVKAENEIKLQIVEYKKQLTVLYEEIKKYPKCQSCYKPFSPDKLRCLTEKELEQIEEDEDQEAENDSCYIRLTTTDPLCNKCYKRILS